MDDEDMKKAISISKWKSIKDPKLRIRFLNTAGVSYRSQVPLKVK